MSEPTTPANEQTTAQLLGIDLRERAERLIAAAEAFADAARELQAEDRRRARRYRAAMLAAMLAVAVLLAGNWKATVSGRDIRDQISSCVTPAGECYQRAQQQQAALVTSLVAAVSDAVGRNGVVRMACGQQEAHDLTATVDERIDAVTACVAAHHG